MRFLKINKPRQFEYKPRFYDPKKEELEQLKAKYGPIDGERYKRRIDFRSAMNEKKEEKLSKPFSMLKILIYAVVAVGLIYFLLYFVERWH
ncbi:MAG: hypothetical protein LBL74_01555 [Bacteroidales bacterium]|jgi:hypothetical protein|nr:hypothetical protein [Bacteroidales bacterium]